MAKSPNAAAVDRIQDSLRESLASIGFRKHSRNFIRTSSDGLTEIINFQMGQGGPPATYHIPFFREKLDGRFTVNVGVYVPEVGEALYGIKPGAAIREYDCCIRERLGNIGPERSDMWWPARDQRGTIDDLEERIIRDALPYLEVYSTRDRILAAYPKNPHGFGLGGPTSRIVVAIILARRGDVSEAKELLVEQVNEARERNPRHVEFVETLSDKLGLGPLFE